MGGKQSIPISSQLPQQHAQTGRYKTNHFNSYFRDYAKIIYLSDQKTKKTVLRRHIILENGQELQQMCAHYWNTDRKPFNVIYPTEIAEWDGEASQNTGIMSKIQHRRICRQSSIASVYFQPFMQSLAHFCSRGSNEEHNKQSKLHNLKLRGSSVRQPHEGVQQNQLWFILNELTHSLEILKNSKHAHWNISPQTIFYNENLNWFIHDSYFVIGPDHQNFLQYKFNLINTSNNHPLKTSPVGSTVGHKGPIAFMSGQLAKAMEQGHYLDNCAGQSQDVYCLGYSILYAMGTNRHLLTEKDALKRHQRAIASLYNLKQKYSDNLLKMVSAMIEPYQNKRITITRLRQKLKPMQKIIIDNSVRKARLMHESSQEVQAHTEMLAPTRNQTFINNRTPNNIQFYIPGSPSTIPRQGTVDNFYTVPSPAFVGTSHADVSPMQKIMEFQHTIQTVQNRNQPPIYRFPQSQQNIANYLSTQKMLAYLDNLPNTVVQHPNPNARMQRSNHHLNPVSRFQSYGNSPEDHSSTSRQNVIKYRQSISAPKRRS